MASSSASTTTPVEIKSVSLDGTIDILMDDAPISLKSAISLGKTVTGAAQAAFAASAAASSSAVSGIASASSLDDDGAEKKAEDTKTPLTRVPFPGPAGKPLVTLVLKKSTKEEIELSKTKLVELLNEIADRRFPIFLGDLHAKWEKANPQSSDVLYYNARLKEYGGATLVKNAPAAARERERTWVKSVMPIFDDAMRYTEDTSEINLGSEFSMSSVLRTFAEMDLTDAGRGSSDSTSSASSSAAVAASSSASSSASSVSSSASSASSSASVKRLVKSSEVGLYGGLSDMETGDSKGESKDDAHHDANLTVGERVFKSGTNDISLTSDGRLRIVRRDIAVAPMMLVTAWMQYHARSDMRWYANALEKKRLFDPTIMYQKKMVNDERVHFRRIFRTKCLGLEISPDFFKKLNSYSRMYLDVSDLTAFLLACYEEFFEHKNPTLVVAMYKIPRKLSEEDAKRMRTNFCEWTCFYFPKETPCTHKNDVCKKGEAEIALLTKAQTANETWINDKSDANLKAKKEAENALKSKLKRFIPDDLCTFWDEDLVRMKNYVEAKGKQREAKEKWLAELAEKEKAAAAKEAAEAAGAAVVGAAKGGASKGSGSPKRGEKKEEKKSGTSSPKSTSAASSSSATNGSRGVTTRSGSAKRKSDPKPKNDDHDDMMAD